MSAALQQEFAHALLDPDAALPAGLVSHTSRAPHRRFAVYRNNVVAGLVNALRARFPATERIVGEDFFVAMAQLFVQAHPPRSKILCEYGDDLPGFIAAFAPAAELAYLPDVARLEAARTRACHAADVQPLDPPAIVALSPEEPSALRFELHPAMQIVRSRHPIVTIWAMNAGERMLGPIDESVAEDALVARPQFDVLVYALPPGGADFLCALASGVPLGAAAQSALARHPHFDLTANLALVLRAGLITATQPPSLDGYQS